MDSAKDTVAKILGNNAFAPIAGSQEKLPWLDRPDADSLLNQVHNSFPSREIYTKLKS